MPGLLDADQVRELLARRQSEQLTRRAAAPATNPREGAAESRSGAAALQSLRKELNSLVALHHHRTGKAHGIVHRELRARLGGPPTAMASAEQLTERIQALRQWR